MIYLDEPDLDYIPSTRGSKVKEFEAACADYLGVSDCVAVNSGTSALFLSLLACGIGPGDEVVVPACTFVGTANAVLYTGAKVRLVDVDRKTWCLPKYNKLYEKRRIKAIIPVSLYGNHFSINYDFRREYIFDMAEAFPTCMTGFTNCYSFNGNKTITTGGGGLIVGHDLDRIKNMLIPGLYDGLGWNMGMPAVNAMLGLEQLKHSFNNLIKKETFNKIYREKLSGLVSFQEIPRDTKPKWWMTACLFPERMNIERIQDRLWAKDVPTRRIFKPLNHYSHIKDNKHYANAEYIYKHGLCLPSSVKNSYDDIRRVCNILRREIKNV